MRRIIVAVSGAVCILFGVGGCAASGDGFALPTHCGIHELTTDGAWFVRDGGALSDGQGNPPGGWDDPEQRGTLEVTGNRAVFTDDVGHRETFTRRDGATGPLQVCS